MTMPNSIPTNNSANHPALQDALGPRLAWAVVASLLGNLLLWRGVSAMAAHPIHFDPKPVEITRVILQPNGKRVEKVVTKKQIERKVVQARKETPKRPPPPPPVERRVRPHIVAPVVHREVGQIARRPVTQPITVRKQAPAKPVQVAQLPPPETARNRVITAPDTHAAAPTDHTVVAGGNAALGKPMNQQGSGNAATNPDTIVKNTTTQPAPKIQTTPDPKPPTKPALPSGNDKKDVPAPDPPPKQEAKSDPPPEPKPKKKGPTREAEPTDQTKPDIPDELKHGDLKTFVRVAVDIDADGSFSVMLRTSSGNPDVDSRVLDALKKWKWKPALKNGEPISSVQRFKFEFEVQ